MPAADDRINWLNMGLMVLACAAALATPFRVFLYAYAILGPLHYLTEISWLHDRDYFAPRRPLRILWLFAVTAAMLAVTFGFVSSDLLGRPVAPQFEIGLVYVAFFAAAIAVFVTQRVNALALVILAALGVALLASQSFFPIAAYLLITIVHVLVFTGCFILYGAAKSRSASGYGSFVVFCLCIAATMIVAPRPEANLHVQAVYSGFEQLNVILLWLGGRRGAAVYGQAGIRVMQLIAFAYTYHYLNWFSKTRVIGWAEVPRRRAIAIVVLWCAGVGLYAYNYRAGFAVLYVLSILHVLLEFPLNHQAMVGLFRMLRSPAAMRTAQVR